MINIPPYLVVAAIIASLLICGAAAELLFAFRVRRAHDRGPALFNTFILIVIASSVCYGAHLLTLHRERLEAMLPAYPAARYAPEREAASRTAAEEWICVTRDPASAVVTFYEQHAREYGYTMTLSTVNATAHILFQKETSVPPAQLFLTIVGEGTVRVLYYSKAGRVVMVPQPRS